MKPSTCSGCPLYAKGKDFVLGQGDPRTAKVAIMLDAPGSAEIERKVDDVDIAMRTSLHPAIPREALRMGSWWAGKNGTELSYWVMRSLGLHERDVFIDGVLRCAPPRGKLDAYPTGDERKSAEAHCRQYDRWEAYRPTVSVISLQPGPLLAEPTPLPLQLADFRKALEFGSQGERALVLAGSKPGELWLGRAGINVLRLRGSYEYETVALQNLRETRRAEGLKIEFGPNTEPKRRGKRPQSGSAEERPEQDTRSAASPRRSSAWMSLESKEAASLRGHGSTYLKKLLIVERGVGCESCHNTTNKLRVQRVKSARHLRFEKSNVRLLCGACASASK